MVGGTLLRGGAPIPAPQSAARVPISPVPTSPGPGPSQNPIAQFTLNPLLNHDAVIAILELYDRHEYDEFDRRLATLAHVSANWVTFEADAEGWVASSPQPERRRLVAAAVALEVALVQPGAWDTDRLAIELGCRLLLNQPPVEAERGWHRAVVSLARLHRDRGVLSPSPFPRQAAQGARSGAPSTHTTEGNQSKASGGSPSSGSGGTGTTASTPPRPLLTDVGMWLDHSRHIAMRFPDEALPAFQNALALENRMEGNETLFVARNSPIWMDAAAVDAAIAEGRQKIMAIPSNRRMDRQSAEKLLMLVPELGGGGGMPGANLSAALTSRWLWQTVDAYQRLVEHEPVAADAYIHLGQTYVRLSQPAQALAAFRRAAGISKTPYEGYLALTLAGAVLERVGKHDEAMVAFLGALEAYPRAQGATLALAPLLFQSGQRDQAADLLEAAVKLPVTVDPLQYYWVGDPEAPWRHLQQVRQALK
jgi:hypothetical protein